MASEQIETVVIGGGQAGLAMSHYLGRLGREHVVLERQRIAERWRSQRWDSLTFQFPNWSMRLPGFSYRGEDPDGFAPRDEVVRFVEDYADFIRAPVRCGVAVLTLRAMPDARRFEVTVEDGTITAANVVIATGPYQQPAMPAALPASLPRTVQQVHSSQYRNPAELPPGAVLVVGSGASGCQIAEDLMAAGRRVYLAVGAHRRVPRRYRGRDFAFWEDALGEFDRSVERRPTERMSPLLTGVGGGHDVNLRALARDGLVLLGRLIAAEAGKLAFAPNLAAVLRRGDEWYEDFIRLADAYERGNRLGLMDDDRVRDRLPDPPSVSEPILELDISAAGITSVIWATGFRYDFSWVHLPVFAHGQHPQEPVHRRGVTNVPGVYFLGLQWLSKRKSSLMAGVGEDAEHLAEEISRRA